MKEDLIEINPKAQAGMQDTAYLVSYVKGKCTTISPRIAIITTKVVG